MKRKEGVGMQPVVLEMKNIHKRFPGVYALKDINFELRKGEVHALLGENGAGKSTLIKILAGIYTAEEGEVRLHGKREDIRSVADSQRHGISVIHQELCLVPGLTIADNIFLGRELAKGQFIQDENENVKAAELMATLGLELPPNTKVSALSVAQQQMVEIAKALSVDADILVMDEPTAALTERETVLLYQVIRRLQAEGISIIYISHRMEELFTITDRVTVMRDGEYIGTRVTAETTKNELIAMMVGRELTDLYKRNTAEPGEIVLEVKGLCRRKALDNISFAVRKGEILGIAGLVGAGRSETARCLFGVDPYDSGEIRVEGKPVQIKSVRDAMDIGIALVPEDRKEEGLVLIRSISYNITLAVLDELKKAGKNENELVDRYIQALSIKTPGNDQVVNNLSGGNQQKVVIAKWLAAGPKVLILDEPTRGVDVGARVEIYGIMSDLARQGVAVIMISSDLPEVINMSDRVLVMAQGRIAGELCGDEITQESVMEYATGGR